MNLMKDKIKSHIEQKELSPYFEALNFFAKIKSISDEFPKNYKENNNNPNLGDLKSIEKFIASFEENFNDDKFKNQNELLRKNPQKLFYFFLDELHKIFKRKKDEENNQIVRAIEYDQNMAKNIFENFIKNDESYITENFYGHKKIMKYCYNCQLTQYVYKYQKAFPIDIKSSTGLIDIDNIDNHLSLFENKFEDNLFCSMCSSKQKFDVTLKIIKKPKILIFVILNNHDDAEINIQNYIYNKCYKLICAVVKTKMPDRSFLDYMINSIFSGCKNKNNNEIQILFEDSEKMLEIKENDKTLRKNLKYKPYVLFYKRIKEEINEKEDSIQEELKSEETLFPSFEKQDDKKEYSNKNKIILYFRLEANEKEIFIDTDDNQTFANIVKKIKMKYKWTISMIDENKLFYNNIKINPKKTPKQLGIENKERIQVSSYN